MCVCVCVRAFNKLFMLFEVYVPWLIGFQKHYETRRPKMRCWGAGRHVIISRRALKNEFDMKSLICFRELTHTNGNLENKADRHLGSECREIWRKLLVSWANKLLMWGHNRWCSDHIYDWLAIKLVSEHTKQAGVYAPAVVLSTFPHLFLHFRPPFRPLSAFKRIHPPRDSFTQRHTLFCFFVTE